MGQYDSIIFELQTFHDALAAALQRCKEQIHENMAEVIPGLWMSNRFQDFDECMTYLNDLIA